MTIKIHVFYSTTSNKFGNCWIQNYLRANSNGKYYVNFTKFKNSNGMMRCNGICFHISGDTFEKLKDEDEAHFVRRLSESKKRVQTFYGHQHLAQNLPNPVVCSIWFCVIAF